MSVVICMFGTPITGANHRRVALRLAKGDGAGDTQAPWRRHAACRGLDPSIFYPVAPDAEGATEDEGATEAEGATELAKAVCGRCSVRGACLEYAVSSGEAHGVWGGLTERERRREIRRRRRKTA